MRRKKLLLFFMVFMLTNAIAIFMPSVIGVSYSTTFDDGTLTQQYSNSWISTGTTDPLTYISDTFSRSGDKSYVIRANGNTFFNYTYEASQYLNEWEIYIYIDSVGASGYTHYLYLKENNGTEIIKLRFYTLSGAPDYYNIFFYSAIGGETQWVTSAPIQTWQKIKITINDNDNVTYYHETAQRKGAPNIVAGYDARITQAHFDDDANAQIFYHDDHTILTGSVFGGGEDDAVTCGETPAEDYIGTIHGGYFYPINEPYIKSEYNVPVTSTFYYLDVDVGSTQYNYDSNLSNYSTYLNGHYLGNPQCFFEYAETHILRWNFYDNPINLTNQKPLIDLYHSTPIYSQVQYIVDRCWLPIVGWYWCNGRYETVNTYWQIGVSSSADPDLDNDLDSEIKESSGDVGTYSGRIINRDLSYKLYFDSIVIPEDVELYDLDIALSGYTAVLDDGTPLYYNKTDTVFITYFLDTLTIASYIRIWDITNSVEVGLDQGFGLGNRLTYTSKTVGFIPANTGDYRVSIYQSGNNVSNKSFYVDEALDPDKILYTSPNPSSSRISYKIVYEYTHPDGWIGAIGMSYEPTFNSKSDCVYFVDNIVSGSTGSFSYSPITITTQYWRLFTSVGNGTSFLPYGGIHKHYIYDTTVTDDYISVAFETVEYSQDYANQRSQIISGSHTHLGADIWIKINGVPTISVSDSQMFNEFYRPKKIGYHNVTLEINNNGTWIFLDYVTFVVIDESEMIPDPSLADLIILAIPDGTTRGIIGMVLALVITFLPFIFAMKMKHRNVTINIPPILYTITFMIGVVVIGLLGFIGWEIMFFLCFIVIAVLVALWLHGKGSTSEA